MKRRFRRNKVMRNVLDTTMIGSGSLVGASVMGKLGNIPGGSPSMANTAMSGLHLANVGQMTKVGFGAMDGFGGRKRKRRKR